MLVAETENIFCGKITPPEFTAEQIEKCRGDKTKDIPPCRHASGKGLWCCHFGVWIRERKIIQPSRKIIRPFPKNNREFNKDRFKRNYAVAVEMAKDSGKVIINEAVFVMRRNACAICPPIDKQGCPCVGCKRWNELVFAEIKCPKGKW